MAIASLFTDDVVYHSTPFEAPLVGRPAVEEHWKKELDGVGDFDVTFHTPVIDGATLAVQWMMREASRSEVSGVEVGALFLEFRGGLCGRLSEYWMLDERSPSEIGLNSSFEAGR